jgi:hypothetical protein
MKKILRCYESKVERYNYLRFKIKQEINKVLENKTYTDNELDIINRYLDKAIGIEINNFNLAEINLMESRALNDSDELIYFTRIVSEFRGFIIDERERIKLVYSSRDIDKIKEYYLSAIPKLFAICFERIDLDFAEAFCDELLDKFEYFIFNTDKIVENIVREYDLQK